MERLRRHGRGHLVREEGVAAVEFALVLPLLLVFILGIVDFGKVFNYKNDETHLANQAARYAAVNACTACAGQTLNTWIPTQAASNELKTGVTIKFEFADDQGRFPGEAGYPGTLTNNHCEGKPVKISMTYDYSFMPFLDLGHVTVKGSATMRLERDWTGTAASGVHTGTSVYDVAAATASNDACP